MKFERWTQSGRQPGAGCAVRLRSSDKTIALMRGAREYFGKEGAVLWYDRKQKVIGLQPAPLSQPHAARIRKTKTGFCVSASSFFKFYEIAPSARRLPAVWDPERGMLLVNLRHDMERIANEDVSSKVDAAARRALKKAAPAKNPK